MEFGDESKKEHRKSHAGGKEKKKKDKKRKAELATDEKSMRERNPKAFAIQNVKKTERRVRRKEDIGEKRKHLPTVDRTPVEPPPFVVAIVGPPKVGKSTLLRCLVKNFTKQSLTDIKGPVTIVSGKHRRLTFIEVSNDINVMIDTAKVADLILLMVDASFGFEMEVFEFLNICQTHGFPRVMGVLTHLDSFKNVKTLRKTKKVMKHRFWTEVYQGAKLFYLSGMVHGEYQKTEIHNLGRFISVMKFRPLVWRESHPYILADRLEDLTNMEDIRVNAKCDRKVSFYGYVRGTNIKSGSKITIPGAGDFNVKSISYLHDPCPLPETLKKRTLVEKEKTIYAPMSGVGGIVYDKDAVYIDLGGSHSHKRSSTKAESTRPSNEMVANIIENELTLDQKMEESEMQMFSSSAKIKSSEVESTDVSENGRKEKLVYDQEQKRYRLKVEFTSDEPKSKKSKLSKKEDELLKEMGMDDLGDTDDDDDNIDVDESDQEEESSEEESEASEAENETESKVQDRSKKKKTVSKDNGKNVVIKQRISDALSTLNRLDRSAIETLDSGHESEESEEKEEGDSEQSDSDSDDNGGEAETYNWKDDMAQKASDAFYKRQSSTVSLRKLVYGQSSQTQEQAAGDVSDDDDDEIGGMFRVRDQGGRGQQQGVSKSNMDDLDSTRSGIMVSGHNWNDEDIRDRIRDCFVTGNWKESEDAEELLKMDDEDEEEVYGDFEDLETGEVFKAEDGADGGKDGDADEDAPRVIVDEAEELKKRREKKRALKMQFDAMYDEGGGDGGKTHYDDLKKEVEEQTMVNRSMFDGMDEMLRIQYEGYRPGMYVKLEVDNVPCELVTNFDPAYPIVIGGLGNAEDQIGFVQCRMKKHRWFPKVLKNRDQLIMSLGWRRFQTLPIYSVQDHNMRHRMIKYTPQHLHCNAHFWGPITPQGTGFLAVQSVSDNSASNFRIAATGVVLEMDKSTQVVKKLKLTGEPYKVFKKTAFVKGMFTSSLEVAKFEGAAIRTVSGIRGQIKKGLSNPEGSFRATFEDKILMSDIVFVKTWFTVNIPKFYASVTNLLMPPEEKTKWQGMRSVGQIKREKGMRAKIENDDHLYTTIARKPKVFNDLKIPRSLQNELPYHLKPKVLAEKSRSAESERVAVVLEPHERKMANQLKMLRTVYQEREDKLADDKAKRIQDLIRKKSAEEERKFKRQKEARQQVARMLSKAEAKKQREEGGGGGRGGRGKGRRSRKMH